MNPQATPTIVEPTWLSLVERLGLPIFLILFACAIVWKLLPHVIAWFTTSTNTAKVVADAVPDIRESLHKMANENGQKLDAIAARTATIEERTARLEQQHTVMLSKSDPGGGAK